MKKIYLILLLILAGVSFADTETVVTGFPNAATCGTTAALGSYPPPDLATQTTFTNWKSIQHSASANASVCQVCFRTTVEISPAAAYNIGVAVYASDASTPPLPDGSPVATGYASVTVGAVGTYCVALSVPYAVSSGTAYFTAMCAEDLATDINVEYVASASTQNYASNTANNEASPPTASWSGTASRNLGLCSVY